MNLHIPYFDDMDYFEFVWKYERLSKYKQERAGSKDLASAFGQ